MTSNKDLDRLLAEVRRTKGFVVHSQAHQRIVVEGPAGQTVLRVGSSRGLGVKAARALLKRHCGWPPPTIEDEMIEAGIPPVFAVDAPEMVKDLMSHRNPDFGNTTIRHRPRHKNESVEQLELNGVASAADTVSSYNQQGDLPEVSPETKLPESEQSRIGAAIANFLRAHPKERYNRHQLVEALGLDSHALSQCLSKFYLAGDGLWSMIHRDRMVGEGLLYSYFFDFDAEPRNRSRGQAAPKHRARRTSSNGPVPAPAPAAVPAALAQFMPPAQAPVPPTSKTIYVAEYERPLKPPWHLFIGEDGEMWQCRKVSLDL